MTPETALEMIAAEIKFTSRRRILIVSGPEALAELRRFLNAGEPKVQRAAIALWKAQAGMISGADVEEMLRSAQPPIKLVKAWEAANAEFARETVVPKYQDAFSETAKNLSARLKRILGKAGLPTSAVVQKWVTTHSGELITRLNKDMHGVINSILREHVIRQPMSPFQLSKLIRPHIGLTERWSLAVSRRYRALVDSGVSVETALAESERYATFLHKVRGMMIGRQELAMAYGEGQWQALVDAKNDGLIFGIIKKTWAAADDERECEECAGLDGEEQDLEKPFSNGVMHNPAHVQCLLPGTRCITAGDPIAGMRAFHRGEAIETTIAGGHRLAVTKNHLLLTPYGFRPAHTLRKGDDIFYSPDFEWIISNDPNYNRKPALIEKIIDSFSESARMIICRMPISAEYFHGDGRFLDGDVDIIRPYGFLGNSLNMKSAQHFDKYFFNSAHVGHSELTRFGYFRSPFKALSLSADSIMSGFGKKHFLFDAHSPHSDEVGFASGPWADSVFEKPISNSVARYTELARKKEFGFSFPIKTQKIIEIKVFNWSGHVYDLQTETSLYIGNGIVSSNCRCANMQEIVRGS